MLVLVGSSCSNTLMCVTIIFMLNSCFLYTRATSEHYEIRSIEGPLTQQKPGTEKNRKKPRDNNAIYINNSDVQ